MPSGYDLKLSVLRALPRAIRRRLAGRAMTRPAQLAIPAGLLDALPRRPGRVAVDVGANLGGVTLLCERRFGPAVVAYEPNPRPRAVLDLVRAARTEVRPRALSDHPGTATFTVPVNGGAEHHGYGSLNGAVAGDELRRFDVPVSTLDAEPWPAPLDFVKIDVEGFEHEVLLGGERTLRRDLPTLLIEIEQRHRARPTGETFELLNAWGYDAFAVTATDVRGLPVGEGVNVVNWLFVPRAEYAATVGRLRTAKLYTGA